MYDTRYNLNQDGAYRTNMEIFVKTMLFQCKYIKWYKIPKASQGRKTYLDWLL